MAYGSIELGAWTETAPTGTLVHDTADHATYPPDLEVNSQEDAAPKFGGVPVALDAVRSGSSDPTTSDVASGQWAIWTNTTAGETRLWANIGGTMYKTAALTT